MLKARLIATGMAMLALAGVGIAVTVIYRQPAPGATPSGALRATSSAAPRVRPSVPARVQHGFPDSRDAGVPAGLHLAAVPRQVSSGRGWRFNRGGWVDVYGRGAVLSGLYIPYNVNITASHVTVEHVRVLTGGPDAIGISLRHAHDVVIEDSTITGLNTGRGRMMTGIKDVFGDSTGVRIMYNNIARFETGIQLESGLVQGNYIHDPGFIAGDHTNGVMSNGGGSKLLTIYHNTIFIDRSQTDAIGLFEDFGAQRDRRITDNLLAGGGYTIYGGDKPGGAPTSDIVITGNVISTRYYPDGGRYGCLAHFDLQGHKNAWTDNMKDALPCQLISSS